MSERLVVRENAIQAANIIAGAVHSGEAQRMRPHFDKALEKLGSQRSGHIHVDAAEYLARHHPLRTYQSDDGSGAKLIAVSYRGDGIPVVIADITISHEGDVRDVVVFASPDDAAGIDDKADADEPDQQDVIFLTEGLILSHYRSCKRVMKHWGQERWLNQPDSPFTFKVIRIRAGSRTSLQYHREKTETYFILTGTARLHYRKTLDGPTETAPFPSGVLVHVKPEQVHRVEALTDIVLIEASTFDDGSDNVRLDDDYGRGNGRIAHEHDTDVAGAVI